MDIYMLDNNAFIVFVCLESGIINLILWTFSLLFLLLFFPFYIIYMIFSSYLSYHSFFL